MHNLLYIKLEENKIIIAIKDGMILAIPTIMVGTLSLLLKSLPINQYQNFINTIFNGMIVQILSFLNAATLGIISLILLMSISYNIGKVYKYKNSHMLPLISICCFLAYGGIGNNPSEIFIDIFNADWTFTAIVISIISSILFIKLNEFIIKKQGYNLDGMNLEFNEVLISIAPFIILISTFSILHFIMIEIFQEVNFQKMLTNIISKQFNNQGRTLLSALLFMFVRQTLWFFGIHGGNVMHTTANQVFEAGIDVNIELISTNMVPTEIFTKTFFDTMVLFGGSGSLLCFILAVFIVSKKKSIRKITKVATLPAIFNMNEILIFGVPIVLNPVLFIPFVLTPMILVTTSYLAMKMGLVPYTTCSVQWTTPIFISGYIVTGSIKGSLLQVFNLFLGTLIYIPFVKYSEERDSNMLKLYINSLINIVNNSESKGEDTNLLDRNGKINEVAKVLLDDIKYAIRNNEIEVHYQPQVNYNKDIIGVEALLRWNHYKIGNMYPPLVIALAKEGNLLDELSDYILDEACKTLEIMQNIFESNIKMSVNICAEELNSTFSLPKRIESKILKYKIKPNRLGIEITERSALNGGVLVKENIRSIRKLKTLVIMDDFGMGHNSLLYLKNHDFDIVKIDGSLVKEILTNDRSREILSTIAKLSNTLEFKTIVEYVETIEQVEMLKSLGCENYQGYYYSKPLHFNELIKYLKDNTQEKSEC